MQRAKWRNGDVRMSRRQHPRFVHVTRFVGAAGDERDVAHDDRDVDRRHDRQKPFHGPTCYDGRE